VAHSFANAKEIAVAYPVWGTLKTREKPYAGSIGGRRWASAKEGVMKTFKLMVKAAAPGLLALCAAAGGAHAITIPPAPVLGPAVVSGEIGFGSGAVPVTVAAPGTQVFSPTIFLNGTFHNVGNGVMSATLGNDPAVLLGAMPALGFGHADGSLEMNYQVEYFDPGAPIGTTIAATVDAADTILQVGGSAAEAVMTVMGSTPAYLYAAYNCSSGLGAAFCSAPIAGQPNAPFTDQTVTMTVNSPYTVHLSLQTYAFSPVQVQVGIDPTFSAPASAGGEFIFSPGVTSGVPEPGIWAMMLVGLGGLGAAMRARRKQTARMTSASPSWSA